MAFNEFDALTDDQLIEAINRLQSDIRQVEHDRSQWFGDDGRPIDHVPADDYMLQDERERLDKLIAESARRGYSPRRLKSRPRLTQRAMPETVITQVFTFSDGSRLRILVDAPLGAIGDLATAAYYRRLLEALDRIEAEAGETVAQGGRGWKY